MKKKILLGRGALFACGSAISALVVVRTALSRRVFVCAMKGVADVIVVHRSAAEWFSSIRWSAAG
jgi:hypothetical protein